MAWTREAAEFASYLGPIVLVQQLALGPPSPKTRGKSTLRLPGLDGESLPALGKFEDLVVAMLPAQLPDGSVQLVIGRDPNSDLHVEDPSVSTRHAAIRWDGKKGIIVDFGSANGTFINRKKMTAQTTLKTGDQLSFGLAMFVYLRAAEFHALLRARKPG